MFYRFKHLNELIISYFIKKIASLIKNLQKIKYSKLELDRLEEKWGDKYPIVIKFLEE